MPERFFRGGVIHKECPRCGVEKPWDEEHYYRAGKRSDGSTNFYTACKDCCRQLSRTDQSETSKERHKRRLRARQRAWVKLGQRYPKEFQDLYEEEMAREYLKHGPMPPKASRKRPLRESHEDIEKE